MASVFGRDVELEAVMSALGSGARPGVAALIEGEPGIGKSTAWAAALERLGADRLVLTARPASSEVRLDLATLADLLETVPAGVIEALPLPQRMAVDAVLLRRSPGRRELEPRVLGTALRSIVATAAAERPVVLAIDDLQWIDAASATVLGYALRRLGEEPVAVLGARRSSDASPLDLDAVLGAERVHRIRLGPLTIAALHHVLRAHRGASVPRSTLVRVHQASRGVPLFALEVLRLLDETGIPPRASRSRFPTTSGRSWLGESHACRRRPARCCSRWPSPTSRRPRRSRLRWGGRSRATSS